MHILPNFQECDHLQKRQNLILRHDNGSNTLSCVSFLFNLSKFNHAMSCIESFQSVMRYLRRLVFAKGIDRNSIVSMK